MLQNIYSYKTRLVGYWTGWRKGFYVDTGNGRSSLEPTSGSPVVTKVEWTKVRTVGGNFVLYNMIDCFVA